VTSLETAALAYALAQRAFQQAHRKLHDDHPELMGADFEAKIAHEAFQPVRALLTKAINAKDALAAAALAWCTTEIVQTKTVQQPWVAGCTVTGSTSPPDAKGANGPTGPAGLLGRLLTDYKERGVPPPGYRWGVCKPGKPGESCTACARLGYHAEPAHLCGYDLGGRHPREPYATEGKPRTCVLPLGHGGPHQCTGQLYGERIA
jgi:hypothetical protein